MLPTYKAAILMLVSVGLLVGLLLGQFGEQAKEAWGMLGLIVGYLIANGQAAARGEISLPAIMPRSKRDEGQEAETERWERDKQRG